MIKYFAYGANLNEDRFKQRCPSVTFLSKATLEGYEYTFPRRHRNWDGGVAGVSKKENSLVEGVIYSISKDDVQKLDEIENIPGGEYTRETVKVKQENGDVSEAWIYVPCPDKKPYYKPSKEYLDVILQGAVEHKLSQDFIKMLESHF